MRKRWPWIVGTGLAISWFAYFETQAFVHPDQYVTLSNFIATIGKWPVAIFFMGQFCGLLQAHLFWPWQQNPLGKGGG